MKEFSLGLEALHRFIAREPLRRVHECVFGVLALESEPIDPRLQPTPNEDCVRRRAGSALSSWPPPYRHGQPDGKPAQRAILRLGSVVAVDPLHPLVALLRLDRQGGDRAGLQPADADRFAGLLAIAVGAVINTLQRLVDFRN